MWFLPLCFVFVGKHSPLPVLVLRSPEWEGAWSLPQLMWNMEQETLAGLGTSWLRSLPLRAPGHAAAGSEGSWRSEAPSPSSPLSPRFPIAVPSLQQGLPDPVFSSPASTRLTPLGLGLLLQPPGGGFFLFCLFLVFVF